MKLLILAIISLVALFAWGYSRPGWHIKRVLTYSPQEKKVRLFRLLWRKVPNDAGYSRSLSLALWPKILRFQREDESWFLTIFGLQVHFKRLSYGGLS